MEDQNLKNLFNENALKNLKDAGDVLGFTTPYETLEFALYLLQIAKAAKEQGKDLCVATMDNDGNALMVDATISTTHNGIDTGFTISHNTRSKFKLPFFPNP